MIQIPIYKTLLTAIGSVLLTLSVAGMAAETEYGTAVAAGGYALLSSIQ